jgi:hypothetical protein
LISTFKALVQDAVGKQPLFHATVPLPVCSFQDVMLALGEDNPQLKCLQKWHRIITYSQWQEFARVFKSGKFSLECIEHNPRDVLWHG